MGEMLFDKPQWSWQKDDEERDYAGVPNRVEVAPEAGERSKYFVLVAIPAEFLKLLKDLSIENVEQLYLEQDGKRWIFGFETIRGIYDLWYYTPATRPMWSMEHWRIK
jgi:hypothetical protein